MERSPMVGPGDAERHLCRIVNPALGKLAECAELCARGSQHGVEFMRVDPQGHFLTQRQLPRMALIHPTRTADTLTLTAPGMSRLGLTPCLDGERVHVTAWHDCVAAIDQGLALADWLSTFLQTPCRLVRQADDAVRAVDREFATQPTDEVSCADGYPLLPG